MNDQTREAAEVLLCNRLFLYSLLHKLFGREPDEELLNILTEEHTGEAFALLSEEEKDIMDRTAAFLLVAYASGLVPWMFISRLTFAYHYFASALFLVPSLCYVFALFENAPRRFRLYPCCFTAVSVLLFAWFFPALNGITVSNELATKLLGWLPTWPF